MDAAGDVLVSDPAFEVEVLDASGVERRTAADDAVNLIAFFEEKLGQI